MADQRLTPTEQDVREVVRRIVDAVYVPPAGTATAVPAAAVAAIAAGLSGAPATGAVTIALGADHGGYRLKELLRWALVERGNDVHDCGTDSEDAVDYPDLALAVAQLVAGGTCNVGIVIDGAGIGSCMAANKVPGIRAAMCYDLSTARNSREHNHANVLTLGARLVGAGLALDIVTEWLATPWGPGRHAGRVDKITAIERQYQKDGTGIGAR